jgi:hypothetical protein
MRTKDSPAFRLRPLPDSPPLPGGDSVPPWARDRSDLVGLGLRWTRSARPGPNKPWGRAVKTQAERPEDRRRHAIARRVARYGRKVVCLACENYYQVRLARLDADGEPTRGRRLRDVPCSCCGQRELVTLHWAMAHKPLAEARASELESLRQIFRGRHEQREQH